MPSDHYFPLTFSGGLNTYDAPTTLPDGQATALENYDWLPTGGITPRPGWKAAGASPTGEPSSKIGRGIFCDWYESGVRKLVVASYSGSTQFSVHKTNTANPTSFSSYTALESAVTITSGYYGDPVDMAAGAGILMLTQPGFPSGQLRTYNGTTVTALATDGVDAGSLSNIAGRAVVYHLNRFWVGGSPTYPAYLRFSAVGDYDAWDLTENYLLVGQDDGEPIESICVWDRGLIVGKQHSLWYVSGNTTDSFAVYPISDRIGCARGRTLIPTPDGVFVISVDGNVYRYNGYRLEPLTAETAVADAPAGGYMSGCYVGDKLFVTTSGQPTWVFAGGVRKETSADTANLTQDLAGLDDRYLLATAVSGTRLLSVRLERGAYATGTYRDPAHDVGASQTYLATTKEFAPKAPLGKSVLRSVYLTYRQYGAGSGEPLTVTPVVEGTAVTAQAKTVGNNTAAGIYHERVDFWTEDGSMRGWSFAVSFSSAPASGEAQTYSIETAVAHCLVDEGRR